MDAFKHRKILEILILVEIIALPLTFLLYYWLDASKNVGKSLTFAIMFTVVMGIMQMAYLKKAFNKSL